MATPWADTLEAGTAAANMVAAAMANSDARIGPFLG
jgi:hypothetical protein